MGRIVGEGLRGDRKRSQGRCSSREACYGMLTRNFSSCELADRVGGQWQPLSCNICERCTWACSSERASPRPGQARSPPPSRLQHRNWLRKVTSRQGFFIW